MADNEHGGCRLESREEIVHAVCVGNDMLTISQNGILRFGFRNAGGGIFLGLNGQGDDLCSLFFILGTVFFQPTELVYTKTSRWTG